MPGGGPDARPVPARHRPDRSPTWAALHLWWYGLGFALGFLEIHLFLGRGRARLGLTAREVWSAQPVHRGRRARRRPPRRDPVRRVALLPRHPWLVPAYWLGGMATHGLLLGAAAGAACSPGVQEAVPAAGRRAGHPGRVPDGARPPRQLHRRADRRQRHRRVVGREVPRRRGLPSPGGALRRR